GDDEVDRRGRSGRTLDYGSRAGFCPIGPRYPAGDMASTPPPPSTPGTPLEYEEDDLTLRLPSRVERRHSRKRWYVHPLLVIGAVTAIAAGLRFYHLSAPHEYVFD